MVVFQLAAGKTQSFVSSQIRDFKYIFLKNRTWTVETGCVLAERKKEKQNIIISLARLDQLVVACRLCMLETQLKTEDFKWWEVISPNFI